MNQEQLSGVTTVIEDLYDLADRNLSDSKLKLLQDEITDMSYDYVLGKLRALKQLVINGQKFDTATVFRFLGVKALTGQEKLKPCEMCDDGYIMATVNNNLFAYACSCELGRFRHKSEHMALYKGQEKTENHKLQTGLIDIDIDVQQIKNMIERKYGAAITNYVSEVDCPF